MKSPRFSSRSSLAVTSAFGLSILLALGTRFVAADNLVPYKTPPSGNVSPTFTSVETSGDVTAGGNLKVGNTISPKQGNTLNLQATDVVVNGNLQLGGQNLPPVLKSNGPLLFNTENVANYLTQPPNSDAFKKTGRVTIQNPFLTGPVTMDNSIYMMKDTLIRAANVISESIKTGSVSTLKTEGGKLVFGGIQAGDVAAIGSLNASNKLTGGNIATYDFSSKTPAAPTSMITPQGVGIFGGGIMTTSIFANQIGDWKMKENIINLNGLVSYTASYPSSCDSGYTPISCDAYFDENDVMNSPTRGSVILSGTKNDNTLGGSCHAFVRRMTSLNDTFSKGGVYFTPAYDANTHLHIQTLCYSSAPKAP